MSKYVIAVYVDNKPGVLTRVSSMFTRRAFNIDTLTVGEIENPAYSRIKFHFQVMNIQKIRLWLSSTSFIMFRRSRFSLMKVLLKESL